MEIPIGIVAISWSFISFLPFFFLLFILGLIKAAIVGPVVVVIVFVGNSSVIIGLWPAHFLWTYYCVAKTKRLGLTLKILLLPSLPVPLVLWPIFGIAGSFLAGVAYGVFTPLISTFEAVGQGVTHKFYHCFAGWNSISVGSASEYTVCQCFAQLGHCDNMYPNPLVINDGCWSTVMGSCTVVRDFTDFCFHSYFSYMDELCEKVIEDENPVDIKLSKVPSCLLVSLFAVPIDMVLITAVALWKSPYMLFKGWQRLLEDLIGREGPFLETVCVPFAGLAIILWPIAVVVAVISASVCGFFLGLYGGFVVHQEDSLKMGFAYIISVVSLFDEYTNDLLYLREGSCLPRPKYSRKMSPLSERLERRTSINDDRNDNKSGIGSPYGSKLISEYSRTLKWNIQQFKPMQVWDWLFQSCEVNGRILLRDGLIDKTDFEECILKGKCKKLGIKLPAWSILQCLLASAKSDSSGLLISDEMELTRNNSPKDKVIEWFIGPLLIMKEQIKGLRLEENEEACLRKLIMGCSNEKPEDWDDAGFPSKDNVRRAQLQAIIRRLQGIVASMSRIPTFRRRFRNLVKMLYVEAIETGALGNQKGGSSTKDKSDRGAGGEEIGEATYDNGNIV